MKRLIIIALLALGASFGASAQVDIIVDTLTDEYLDTVQVKKKLKINDYSLLGVQYGVGLSQVMWNPSKNQKMVILPYNFNENCFLYQPML